MMPAWIAVPIALAVLFVLGSSVLVLVARRTRLLWFERCALAWLFGAGAGTIAWFLLMPLYRWVSPVWMLTAGALVLALSARPWDIGERTERRFALTSGDAALGLILVLQFAAVGLTAMWTTVGWDGLFNFEMKARLAFEHAPPGQLPAAYFADTTRGWSHPRYPLLVPFTEFWIYSWMGRIDQSAIKVVFPIFYYSLVALVCGGVRRLANRRTALVAAIALGCLPPLTVLPGATSGYADVPLAAAAAGAACFTFLAIRARDPQYLNVAAGLLAVAVWTKAEGVILAGAIGGAALAAGTVARHRLFALLWVPAVALMPWRMALEMYGALPADDFRSLNIVELISRSDTFTVIAGGIGRELLRPAHWGLVWPCFFASAVLMVVRRRSNRADWFLVAAVLVPLHAYALAYLFSAWSDVSQHVGFSLPRLLVPLAPVATLYVIRQMVDELGIQTVEWA